MDKIKQIKKIEKELNNRFYNGGTRTLINPILQSYGYKYLVNDVFGNLYIHFVESNKSIKVMFKTDDIYSLVSINKEIPREIVNLDFKHYENLLDHEVFKDEAHLNNFVNNEFFLAKTILNHEILKEKKHEYRI